MGPRVGGPILSFDRFSADVHSFGDRKRRNDCGACAVGASDVDIGLGCGGVSCSRAVTDRRSIISLRPLYPMCAPAAKEGRREKKQGEEEKERTRNRSRKDDCEDED